MLIRIAAAGLGAIAVAPHASAQSGAPKPIFEPSTGAAGSGPMFDVRADLAEAYDDNLVAASGVIGSSNFQNSGHFTSLTPQVDFQSQGDRVQVSVTGGSSLRYYPNVDLFVGTNHYVGADLGARLARRTRVSLNQGVTYGHAYLYGLLSPPAPQDPGDVAPAAANYSVNDQRSLAYVTAASMTQSIGRRTAVSVEGAFRSTKFEGTGVLFADFSNYDVASKLTYSVGRNVQMNVGYLYRSAKYAAYVRPTEHDLDFGLEYTRPLSATRRATVAFTLGPRLLNMPILTASSLTASSRSAAHYSTVGDASFSYGMTRTWNAVASYRRGVMFLAGLTEPTFIDGVTAMTSGFLNRRTALSFSGAYSKGDLGFAQAPSPLTTYSGSARLQVGLTRVWAVFGEYLLYFYNFSPDVQLLPGVPHSLRRNGVRAGLTLWIPVRSR